MQSGQERTDLRWMNGIWCEEVIQSGFEVIGAEVLGSLNKLVQQGLEGIWTVSCHEI